MFTTRSNNDSLTNQLDKLLTFYKKDNLVYALVLKNASSYYTNLFEYNNWQKIIYREINWNDDHLFGFIMDPIKRFYKGVTQDLVTNNIKNISKFLNSNIENNGHFLLMTPHSTPITFTHRSIYRNIDWIPLDLEQSSDYYFKKLLEHHNIKFKWTDVNDYKSNTEKTNVYDELKRTIPNNSTLLYQLLHEDIMLYEDVIRNFDSTKNDWNSISWLKKI